MYTYAGHSTCLQVEMLLLLVLQNFMHSHKMYDYEGFKITNYEIRE